MAEGFLEELRRQEERYLRTLSGLEELRLFFSPGASGYTNGADIVIDPYFAGAYKKKALLQKAGESAGLRTGGLDEGRAAAAVARALSLHELFHILYSDFTALARLNGARPAADQFGRAALFSLNNLVEDCFVNNAGTAAFGGTAPFIRFLNALLFSELDARETAAFPSVGGSAARLAGAYLYEVYAVLKNGRPPAAPENSAVKKLYEDTRPLLVSAALQPDPIKRQEAVLAVYDALCRAMPVGAMKAEKTVPAWLAARRLPQSLAAPLQRGAEPAGILPLYGSKERALAPPADLAALFPVRGALSFLPEPPLRGYDAGLIAPAGLHGGVRLIETVSGSREFAAADRTGAVCAHTYARGFARLSAGRRGRLRTRTPIKVLLLIDGSAGWDGAALRALTQGAETLAAVLSAARIELAVAEHRAERKRARFRVSLLRAFGDRGSGAGSVDLLRSGLDSRRSLALWWARDYLGRTGRHGRRILLSLFGGVPQNDCPLMPLGAPLSVRDEKDALLRLRADGIEAAGVLLSGDVGLREIYRRFPGRLIQV
ncbi:MAG: hypothetical protein LBH24_04685, partial [Clostridiales bacterium]|nr:hypothetical protein [Clostridiales bacterium]